jgi:hypothetical protein
VVVVVVVGVVVVAALAGRAAGVGDGEPLALLGASVPLDGGLLDGGLLDGGSAAGGTPPVRMFAVPSTAGVLLPPSSAAMAQTNKTAPTAEPAMATTRRRRYTDAGSGPLGSFTIGN